ncbi:cell wall anchor protein [Flavobacterium sp. GCM10027622]|uniref:cell wall anchor protein n=1 Tax=unclassified Flavobacterium TaxID=196869 RepID=UPI003620FFE0
MKRIILASFLVCGVSLYAQVATKLDVADTRNTNDLPNFSDRGIRADFKFRSVIGVPGTGTYSANLTINQWTNSDNSGGKVHQLNFNDGGIFYRNALPLQSSWDTWRKLVVAESNGNVGIGTDVPLGLLHVGDNTGAGILFSNKISGVSSQIPGQIAWGDSSMGLAGDLIVSPRTSIANNSVRFYTNDGASISERFRIAGNGDIGVGTNAPQAKLDVRGKSSFSDNMVVNAKIEAKIVKVTATPTADFVFEEDYGLPKLEEVEKHIKAKKHLPEIASAKEMEKEGVDVGEFQIKLLQKIEELTLYVIDQNKRIKELEAKLEEKQK